MPGSAQGWDQDQGDDPRDSTIDLPRLREAAQLSRRPAPHHEPGSSAPPSRSHTQPARGPAPRGSGRHDAAGHDPLSPDWPGRDPGTRDQDRNPGRRDPGSRDLTGYGRAGYDQADYDRAGYGRAARGRPGYDRDREPGYPGGPAADPPGLPPAEPPLTGLPPAEPPLAGLPPDEPPLAGLPPAEPPPAARAASMPPFPLPSFPEPPAPAAAAGPPDPALAALAERIRELQALSATAPATSPRPPGGTATAPASSPRPPGMPPASTTAAPGAPTYPPGTEPARTTTAPGDSAGPGQPATTGSAAPVRSAPEAVSEGVTDAAQLPEKSVRTGQYDSVSDRRAAEPEPVGGTGLAPRADLVPDRAAPSPAASSGYSSSPASPGAELEMVGDRAVEQAASEVFAYQSAAQPARRGGLRAGPADGVSMPQDRPARGSLAELRLRLERLPAGHPSSPYDDTGAFRPSPQQLRQLELPLADEERDAEPPARASLLAATAGTGGSAAGQALPRCRAEFREKQ